MRSLPQPPPQSACATLVCRPWREPRTLQGVEVGIGIGVGLSLAIVIYKSAFPRIAVLGRLPDSTMYR